MFHTLSRTVLAAAMAFSLVLVSACTTGPTFVLPSAVGTELKDDFWQAYYPDFKKDMTWTYVVTADGNSGESVWKVTDVTNGVATISLKTSVNGTVVHESTDKLSKSQSSDNSGTTYKYLGKETLTLHGTTYTDAVKVETTDKDGKTTTVWVAKGIGMIKTVSEGATAELKAKSGF